MLRATVMTLRRFVLVLIFMVSIHLLNHTHSCNFTQLKHHFCCLGPRTALLTSTTRPSLMKKRHCTKQSIMATLSITPDFSAIPIFSHYHTMRSFPCMSW